ncbi:AraC-type transcriptional regulator domain protein [Pseudomonas fluorescens Q2-87]|uniref:AraC-type transcriptional regulator domain protein n=1 Tax=Pseudomonas fluorescens (strain Q2-87) TaxID=1038922 RepID=J2F5E9_PSEFQ|nr:AraC-type transcriptional regulator domain protein [Pseudomonas fluorescens Q2-87]
MSVSTSIHIAPDDGVSQRRAELAELMKRFAPEYGVHPTAIEALHLIRSDQPTEALHTVHKPGLCVIVEGRKRCGWRMSATCMTRSITWLSR